MQGHSPGTSRCALTAARLAPLCTMAVITLLPLRAIAQNVAERTPNLSTTWAPVRGVIQFNFTHRFDISDAPLRKITNTPSFQVATGLAGPLSAGFVYGSNSDLVAAYPNEWEWFSRWSALSQEDGAALDASLQAGWNVAAESFDAELSVARAFGPLRLLAAGRAFHHAFYEAESRYAVAGGAAFRLLPWLTLAGDYATLIDRTDAERPAWGAGLQLSIPSTPHSISLHAGNVGTGSLEGASRGTITRWGFEYTVPITLARYAGRHTPRRTQAAHDEPGTPAGDAPAQPSRKADTVVVTIRNFAFARTRITINAGDVVVWRNFDQVDHIVQGSAGDFESPLIEPRMTWARQFTTPGTFTYFCKPHPFMKAEIRVREPKP